MNDKEKLRVADHIKAFNKIMQEVLPNYPRKYYKLRDRIESTGYDILELSYLANTMEDRIIYQKMIISKIAMLDYYLTLSYDYKIISLKKLKEGTNKLIDIRRLTYRWMEVNASKLQ